MPIIGFNIDKILVENKTFEKGEKVNKVETHIVINDVRPEKTAVSVKEGVIRLDFLFELAYEPRIADMLIAGHVTYVDSEKEIKQILADWKKDRGSINLESIRSILNMVLIKCNIKALSLSQEVNLPPHLPLPLMFKQQPKNDAEKYIG